MKTITINGVNYKKITKDEAKETYQDKNNKMDCDIVMFGDKVDITKVNSGKFKNNENEKIFHLCNSSTIMHPLGKPFERGEKLYREKYSNLIDKELLYYVALKLEITFKYKNSALMEISFNTDNKKYNELLLLNGNEFYVYPQLFVDDINKCNNHIYDGNIEVFDICFKFRFYELNTCFYMCLFDNNGRYYRFKTKFDTKHLENILKEKTTIVTTYEEY